MLTREAPQSIGRIKPAREDFPMSPYTDSGRLFSNDQLLEDFFRDIYKRWMGVPKHGMHWDEPPHVFRFDFHGVEKFDPTAFKDGFVFVWGNMLGGLHSIYSFYDNVSPWEEFLDVMDDANKSGLVVVARREDLDPYELVGRRQLVARYQNAMVHLAEEGGWVHGLEFSEKRLHSSDTNLLREMHANGLVLRKHLSGRPYYYSTFL